MLSKNNIDKKLRNYIKEHLSKGYTGKAVKHVLVKHGYDESYVDNLLRRHYQLQYAKVSSILISFLLVISMFTFNLLPTKPQSQITGYAVSNGSEGCCTSICRQTSKQECYGNLIPNKKCSELEECNVGCCIDKEGYCLTNYLNGNCKGSYGTNINRDCRDIIFCRNITDKSYASRLYSIKNKKGEGISAKKSSADYHKSSFSIQYYVYDKEEVLSVRAEISDNGVMIDSVGLYDDGSHNDGSKNDNLYGNNWLSSTVNDFEGFKKLDVDIVIRYKDNTKQSIKKAQSIVLVSNSKCLPVGEWDNPSGRSSIIFAAQNYDGLGDGYRKFETDAQNLLDALFSIGKFADNRDKLNIYRLEQSLSYFNIPTLASIASSSCPSYSNRKDLIIVLDPNEQYCVLENNRIIRVSPQVLFYQNISNADLNQTFADFCSYVLTPKKLADGIIAFATPPTIAISTPANITYNTGSINLSFSVSAANYPVNYSVLVENARILSKLADEQAFDNILLNLTNGTNAILIKAVDKNKNRAYAPILLNVEIQ